MKFVCLFIVVVFQALVVEPFVESINRPNILFFVADDLGYNDLSSYGHPTIDTRNIDRIAAKGVKFTQFYQGGSLCTPSRSAMMTGRLPIRSGIYTDKRPPLDDLSQVFVPTSLGCLPDSEITIGEALKPDYATGYIGKWHLGHNQNDSCLVGGGNQGFDFFYGIPYSHEAGFPGPFPESVIYPPVPLMTNDYKFVEQPFNSSDLTSSYTTMVVDLIKEFGKHQVSKQKSSKSEQTNMDFTKPFFITIAYENPHVPLFLSSDYNGASLRGLYGDSVEEMDQSIGKIMNALDEVNLLDNTLVAFTSDNGAWPNPSNGVNDDRFVKGVSVFDGGSNAPFQGGKGSTWEGGFRVPLVMQYPKIIPPAQIQRSPATGMDLFSTFLSFAGMPIPRDRLIDGIDLSSMLMQPDEVKHQNPHDCIYFWRQSVLYAIRCDEYKAHFITRSGFNISDVGTKQDPPLLFQVEWDPAEAYALNTNLPEYREILDKLITAANAHISSVEETKLPSEYNTISYEVALCCGGNPFSNPTDAKNYEKKVSPYLSPQQVNGDIYTLSPLDGSRIWKDCYCDHGFV